jgi:hypothetical protein
VKDTSNPALAPASSPAAPSASAPGPVTLPAPAPGPAASPAPPPSPAYRSSGRLAIVALVLSGLLAAGLAYAGVQWAEPILSAAAASIALGSSILFVASYSVPPSTAGSGKERLRQFARDSDGYPSLAILQFFVWTGVIIFAFSWVAFIRIFSGVPAFPSSVSTIPANLLAVMGVSASSTLASASVGTLRITKKADGDTEKWNTLLEEKNDEGQWRPSLGRFQMFAWTVISVGIYLAILFHTVAQFWNHGSVGSLALPDLDSALLVLMGISHAGYVGSKYISIDSQNTATKTKLAAAGAKATEGTNVGAGQSTPAPPPGAM